MTRAGRWSTTLAATAGAFLVGIAVERLVVDWSSYIILGVGLSLLGVAAGTWVFEWWRTRHERRADRQAAEDHDLATKADQFRDRQEDRRKAEELRAFLDSPAGQHLRQLLAVVSGSVRIQAIHDGPPSPAASAQWTVQIDKGRVAYVDLDLKSLKLTWRQRTVCAVAWLSNRPWWVGRPMTMRILAWALSRLGARLRKPGHSARVHQRLREFVRKNRAKSRPESLDTRDPVG